MMKFEFDMIISGIQMVIVTLEMIMCLRVAVF